METVIRIVDFEDERIADYRNVKDAQLERRRGLFVVEGLWVVSRFLRQKRFPIRSLLILENKLERLSAQISKLGRGLTVYVADTEVLDQILGFPFHRGVIALGERCPPPALETFFDERSRIMVLEGLTSPENVGSVFRNAAGLGADGVFLDPSCADPLYRLATRVSIGTTLTLAWTRSKKWPDDLAHLKREGFVLAALSPSADACDLNSFIDVPEKLALLVGSEGAGLKPDTLAKCDLQLKISMQADVDSLNVATAAAIALFALARPPV